MSTSMREIALDISNKGGNALIFGGYVRDNFFLNIPNHDVDVEVYGMSMDDLIALLRTYGHVDTVGKSFAVIKLRTFDNEDFDFSLPRREKKTGVGHAAFEIESDSNMSVEEAASRRDFTINAIGYNPLTEEFVDPFTGISDISNGILRATSPRFAEDPLRVLRGMQFAARFGFIMEPKTVLMCKNLIREFQELSSERVAGEFLKIAMKSKYPSKAFKVLDDTNWINCFPAFRGFRANFPREYYTNIASLDRFVSEYICLDVENKITLFFSILLKGLTFDASVLHEFGIFDKSIVSKVNILLKNYDYDCNSEESVYKLAEELCPETIRDYVIVQGCQRKPTGDLTSIAIQLRVLDTKLDKLVTGQLLISMGMKPNKEFGRLIDEAYKAQMAGFITDEMTAKNWIASL